MTIREMLLAGFIGMMMGVCVGCILAGVYYKQNPVIETITVTEGATYKEIEDEVMSDLGEWSTILKKREHELNIKERRLEKLEASANHKFWVRTAPTGSLVVNMGDQLELYINGSTKRVEATFIRVGTKKPLQIPASWPTCGGGGCGQSGWYGTIR